MRRLSLLFAAVLLAGCVNVGGKRDLPVTVHYVLEDRAPGATGRPPAVAPVLIIPDVEVRGLHDGEPLVFARTADTRSTYQFARWTERPGKRLGTLMRARLDAAGWPVVRAGSLVRGDWLLETQLIEFHHDASTEPGVFRMVLRAEIIDLGTRSVRARKTFAQSVPLARFDAAGAAEAASQATTATLETLVDWLASQR